MNGVWDDGGYVRFHASHLDSGLRRKDGGGVGDDGGYVQFHAPRSQVPAFAGKTLRVWRVEATPLGYRSCFG